MKKYTYLIVIMLLLVSGACEEEWLEVRRDKKQVIPQKIEDFQALLDYFAVMNVGTTPSLGEVGSDDFYVMEEDWENLNTVGPLQQKNAYIWAEEIFDNENRGSSWYNPYRVIYYSNVALEGIADIDVPAYRREEADRVVGSALFYRSWSFYQLAQIFSKQYDPATAASDPGIPLRLESDANIPSVRASVEAIYSRIISDLEKASDLLPPLSEPASRPSQAAAFALLARVYLQMGNYEDALTSANQSLAVYDKLMDYNSLDPAADYPIEEFNMETLFYNSIVNMSSGILLENKLIVTPELYDMYEDNDLRKAVFYYEDNGVIRYKGSYANADFFGLNMFSGLATDEVYLIKAEAHARLDQPSEAAQTLDMLLQKRYATGTYAPAEEEGILQRIIAERRKELVFRGIRWSDLRRLNQEQQFQKTLYREIGDITYSLEPNSPRYVLPIPNLVISLTGMPQNER